MVRAPLGKLCIFRSNEIEISNLGWSKYFTINKLPKIFTGIRNYCCSKFNIAKLNKKVNKKLLSDAILIFHFPIAFPCISK
jgi:hypothetical protein